MKQFYKYILTLVVILMVTSNAWAGDAIVNAKSDPSDGGWVYVNNEAKAPGSFTLRQDDATHKGSFWRREDGKFYLYYKCKDGYTFKGWYKVNSYDNSCSANSSSLTGYGQEVTHEAASGWGEEKYYYYAIFATLQSSAHNTTVQFNDTKVDEQSSKSITIKHSHAGTVSLSLSGTNAGDFSLSENSFTSTSYQEGRNITIYFKPTCAGERTATLTISSKNGLSSLTINLKGNGLLHESSISWNEPIDVNMFVGGTRLIGATATVQDEVSYSSFDNSIISVNGNELTAVAEGEVTITATQAATCKYESVSITKKFYVHNKKTPTFWLNGNPDQLTDNLKTEDTRTITITNVDESMTATYNPNLLQYTFNGNNATITALDAGTATLTLSQPETNEIFEHERTFTFYITKYNTNTITNDLATEYMVDDVIEEEDIYTINNNEVPVEIISGNENILKFENGKLKAVNAGTTTITVKQAETNKWVGISATKTITIHKYDIDVAIRQSTAVWNELILNPFAATSTHPVSGQVTTFQDHNFNVAQQGNEHIALMDANTRDIQTYYTNGKVDFLITRDADRKYNALNQTLTLTVNANENGCTLLSDPTHYKIGMYDNSNGVDFTLPGIGDVLTFQLWKNTAATQDVHVYGYNAAGTQVLDKKYENSSITTNENNPNNCSVQLSEDIVKIKIKAGGTLNKHFKNLNITRKQDLQASTTSLTLNTTAINLPVSKSFTLDWSTCSDEIILTHNNPRFSLNTYKIDASDVKQGTTTITVTCDAEVVNHHKDTIIIYDQSRSIPIPINCLVNDKSIAEIKGATSHSMQVDGIWETGFEFIKTSYDTPTNNTADYFYYTISNNFGTNTYRKEGYPYDVITFDPETKKVYAHNAGTAVLTIIQQENAYHYTDTLTCTITVAKHTPEFTWQDPVYFNKTISDYFTTNNTDTEISITQSSTDTDVAVLYFDPNNANDKHTLDLTTYYKETTPASSTTVTVAQAEDYYWYAHSEPHTITPTNEDNHVQFTLTQQNYINVFQHSYHDLAADYKSPMGPDWSGTGIHFGGENILGDNEGWNWDEKYMILEFTGIPDSLFFSARRSGGATGTIKLTVAQGTKADNLSVLWEQSGAEYQNIGLKLNPNTRFIKLSYTGNLSGYFYGTDRYSGITVTEFNEFRASKETLDFETISITDNTSKSLTFDFYVANAGYNVNIDLDRTGEWADETAYNIAKQYISITPTSITDIGGEKLDTVRNITVTLHSDDQTAFAIPDNARIKIYDEVGHVEYISLKGEIQKSKQTLKWSDYFCLDEPIQIPINTDSVRNAATASSNLPVQYRSSDENVIKISPNGRTFIPAGEGTATITAYQNGNAQYDYVEDSKDVEVTKKNIQLIHWNDDFSDLIFEQDDNLTLNAQVYIIDVVNSTFEFSQTQTDSIRYTVENTNIVAVDKATKRLKVIGIGETTIKATIAEDEFHQGVSVTLPVCVREPAIGCEDKLLAEPNREYEFFRMNTSEITLEAIPLDTVGVPGYLLFQHKGEPWAVMFYNGSIKAQYSTDNTKEWQDIPNTKITPTRGTYQQTDSIPIDRNTTHIRFVRPLGGQGYHYVKDIKVVPAQFLETNTDTIDFEDINMGGLYTKQLTINYSNIKSPLIITTSSKDVTVSQNRIGECSGFGNVTIDVNWQPNTQENQYITIQDTLINLSVQVDLVANIQLRKQKIVWENRPTIIISHTDIDNRPKHTRDVNNNELTELNITYKVIIGGDSAYFEDDMFFIINTDTITIKASQPGNSEYLAVDSIYQFIIQGVPPTFIGGASTDAWEDPYNWVNNYLPNEAHPSANVAAHATINSPIELQGLRIANRGTVNIADQGGLTVGKDGIQCSNNDGKHIIINNLHNGAGFLRISPEYQDEMPKVTMRYQTRSTLDNGANKDATWQYIGAPGNNTTIYVDYNTWLYQHSEKQDDWVIQPRTDSVALEPFKGYSITQYGQPTYKWTAEMTNQNCTIPLTYSKNGRGGRHIIANSYTAPINVAAFTGDEFTYLEGMSDKYRIEKTLYLYNSGSWNQWHEQDSLGSGTNTDGTNTPGQYYAIPVLAAGENYLDGLQSTITPMQGIYLRVRSKTPLDSLPDGGEQVGNLILNYEQLVMGSDHEMHRPMRAPQRTTSSAMQDPNFRRVRIVATSENSGADRVYIIQDNINTRKYNNGYDAPNQETKGLVNIYTNESFGKMEVSCSNNIDSMYIGFMAGEDQHYSLHFSAMIGDMLYLDDLETGQTISIFEGGTYSFTATPKSTNNNRFLLRLPKQNISTDIDDISHTGIRQEGDIVYIEQATCPAQLTIYTISGQTLLTTTIHHTPYSIDLSHLTEGVYLLSLNNMVYKIICN